MANERIKDLDNLLKPILGENVEIVEKSITNLTLPGENYWSDMLKLDITTRNKDRNTTKVEHFVAKCCVSPELLPKGMDASFGADMFKPEIAFYREIVPTMQKVLKEHGMKEVEFFPKLIAARYNLQDTGEPDENAVMILENLQVEGYGNEDRHKGFDLDAAKILISDLAVFHAISLAIKLKDPDLFQKVFVNNCQEPMKPKGEPKEPGPGGEQRGPPIPKDILKQILKEDSMCRKHADKLDDLIDAQDKKFKSEGMFKKPDPNRSIFSGFVHKDMWVNNTMQLKNKEGKIVKNKFIDFQMYNIEDVTEDLIFFLISSVDIVSLEEHFDYLLMFYHEYLIKTLESLKCDVAPFNYVNFMNNLRANLCDEFIHLFVMINMVIYAKKGQRTDFGKPSEELKDSTLEHPVAKKKFLFLFKLLIKNELI